MRYGIVLSHFTNGSEENTASIFRVDGITKKEIK
jgi:hypothetical protein